MIHGPRVGSLCTGVGGLDLATCHYFGGEVVWHAEVDKRAAAVLEQRFPDSPNLGDIKTVDWTRVPKVDILTAG